VSAAKLVTVENPDRFALGGVTTTPETGRLLVDGSSFAIFFFDFALAPQQ
jgi:hypothetical protein